MERLPFRLPDFLRVAWVSLPARRTWEPRFRSVSDALFKLQWVSVQFGLRRCCKLMLPSGELYERFTAEFASAGLSCEPLQDLPATSSRGNTRPTRAGGERHHVLVVIGKEPDVERLRERRAVGRLGHRNVPTRSPRVLSVCLPDYVEGGPVYRLHVACCSGNDSRAGCHPDDRTQAYLTSQPALEMARHPVGIQPYLPFRLPSRSAFRRRDRPLSKRAWFPPGDRVGPRDSRLACRMECPPRDR